jgi:hypothetical protein
MAGTLASTREGEGVQRLVRTTALETWTLPPAPGSLRCIPSRRAASSLRNGRLKYASPWPHQPAFEARLADSRAGMPDEEIGSNCPVPRVREVLCALPGLPLKRPAALAFVARVVPVDSACHDLVRHAAVAHDACKARGVTQAPCDPSADARARPPLRRLDAAHLPAQPRGGRSRTGTFVEAAPAIRVVVPVQILEKAPGTRRRRCGGGVS